MQYRSFDRFDSVWKCEMRASIVDGNSDGNDRRHKVLLLSTMELYCFVQLNRSHHNSEWGKKTDQTNGDAQQK